MHNTTPSMGVCEMLSRNVLQQEYRQTELCLISNCQNAFISSTISLCTCKIKQMFNCFSVIVDHKHTNKPSLRTLEAAP